MGLIRAERSEVEARVGAPVEEGCGGSPLGTVWPCGCFALSLAPPLVDWLPCGEHSAAADALGAEHLGDLWQSRLRL
jgi:hypothetical protein